MLNNKLTNLILEPLLGNQKAFAIDTCNHCGYHGHMIHDDSDENDLGAYTCPICWGGMSNISEHIVAEIINQITMLTKDSYQELLLSLIKEEVKDKSFRENILDIIK